MKTTLPALLSVALFAVVAAGGPPAVGPKPVFEFKCEGDTIETFKAELVVHEKVDTSSARGTVTACLGFIDNRDASQQAREAMREKVISLVTKALAPWEEKLLAAEVREALAKARKEDAERVRNNDWKTTASVITSETKQDDGSVLIESTQQTTHKVSDKTGKMNPILEDRSYRFTCVKDEDGKWRISKLEELKVRRDHERKEISREWKEDHGILASAITIVSTKLDPAAEPKQDTPENAALSIFNSLLVAYRGFEMKAGAAMIGELLKQVEPLVTLEYWAGAKAAAAERADEFKKQARTASGTEAATEGKDGAKIVKFKKSTEWRDDVQATVKQVGGKWVVVEAGVWENKGGIDTGPQYRAIADIYKLPKP